LDKKFEDGGAGWDKRKVESFAQRISGLLEQSDIVVNSPEKAPGELLEYLTSLFDLELDDVLRRRFMDLLRQRMLNGIDGHGLKSQFDLTRIGGGLGLYSGTAEKIAREIEIIMLMGYSSQ